MTPHTNEGTVNGYRYFRCPDKHGVLVAPSKIARLGLDADTTSTWTGSKGKPGKDSIDNLRRRTSFAVSAIGGGAASEGGPARCSLSLSLSFSFSLSLSPPLPLYVRSAPLATNLPLLPVSDRAT
jgi:hypothetical protein